MAFPFPGLGSFTFAREEREIWGSDRGWRPVVRAAIEPALGAAVDTVVVLARGSAVRSFEVWLSPSRLAELTLLVGTVQVFTDWERPVPESRSAYIANVDPQEWAAAVCSDGTTEKRVRVTVELVSQ